MADHIEVLTEAIAQIPARYRRDLLVTVDGAGASHGLVEHLTTLNAAPGRRVHYSIGWELGARERAALARAPEHAWDHVLDTQGQPRDLAEAATVELTALLREHPDGDQLASWPTDLRIIARREKPHPGAQISLFEQHDGWRYQLLATNTPTTTAQFLEARHRPHARVEDNIRCGGPSGTRAVVEIKSAEYRGERLRAKLKGVAAADWAIVSPDGIGLMDVRLTIEAEDGALIYVSYGGRVDLSTGLEGATVYTAPRFETGDDRYAWINKIQAVAKGVISGGVLR